MNIATTVAIVALDTAENGPSKVRQVTNEVCRNLGFLHFYREQCDDEVVVRRGAPNQLPRRRSSSMLPYVATNFVRHLTNFRRSVLGCIDASDSESRLIFQHFSRST